MSQQPTVTFPYIFQHTTYTLITNENVTTVNFQYTCIFQHTSLPQCFRPVLQLRLYSVVWPLSWPVMDTVSLNIGNSYSPVTGQFTVPYSGLYSFTYGQRPTGQWSTNTTAHRSKGYKENNETPTNPPEHMLKGYQENGHKPTNHRHTINQYTRKDSTGEKAPSKPGQRSKGHCQDVDCCVRLSINGRRHLDACRDWADLSWRTDLLELSGGDVVTLDVMSVLSGYNEQSCLSRHQQDPVYKSFSGYVIRTTTWWSG